MEPEPARPPASDGAPAPVLDAQLDNIKQEPVPASTSHLALQAPGPHTAPRSSAHSSASPQPRQTASRRTPRNEKPPRASLVSGGSVSAAGPTPGEDGAPARPLNVTDALTYLDDVKEQFTDAPGVYNRFLDIMKEFKTEQLDTPGVIERVSTLFAGHPRLIQGFNTFLPAGYHIECSPDHAITVTTPTGTQTTHTAQPFQTHNAQPTVDLPPVPSPVPPFLPPTAAHLASALPPGSPSAHASRGATVLSAMHSRDAKQAPQAEFGHAISFINKIKARYSHDPDVYNTFLQILQTYQTKQGKNASEAQPMGIYSQVKKLLVDAPDLIDEFKQFLPELANDPTLWEYKPRRKPGASAAPAPAPGPKRKKRAEKEEPTRPSPQKKPKHHHAKDVSPAFQPERPVQPPPPQRQVPMPPIPAGAITTLQQQQGHTVASQEELQFFEKLKRHFEDRAQYDEFLKLLNLFSKDIISAKVLIERAKTFLGEGNLLDSLKVMVSYNETKAEPNQPLALTDRVRVVEDCGPSYRRLPPDQVALACSGRDELARSVLNDEWVSHPTWMSEDSVFQSHKKNQFEEALHRSEEERHEYDFHIEALTRTIALLEPIFQKILHMTDADRLAFKLPAGLGASSPSIHLRILKKVYGRDAGMEVALALQETPGIAIPVVLPRLKQKDEEWRRARREWNKVWREIDIRNFYKSLDHQGITFKQNDKKTITAKQLVHQIEAARAEAPRTVRTGPQLAFEIADEAVLKDAMKLVFSLLDRVSGTGSNAHGVAPSARDGRRAERLLRELIPLFLMVDMREFDEAFGPAPEGEEIIVSAPPQDDDEMDTSASTPTRTRRGGGTGSNSPRGAQNEDLPAGDLRKRLLTVQHQSKKRGDGQSGVEDDAGSVASGANGAEAQPAQESTEGAEKERTPDKRKRKAAPPPPSRPSRKRAGDDLWIKHRPDQSLAAAGKESDTAVSPRTRSKGKDKDYVPALSGQEPSKRTTPTGRLPFFANSLYYTLFRLIQILYARLHACKTRAEAMTRDPSVSHAANPAAVELGLHDPIYGLVGSLVSPATMPSKGKGKSKASSRSASAAPRSDTPADDLMDVDTSAKKGPKAANGNAAPHFYAHMLELCEKFFEGDLEAAGFEENLRFMFGTQAYVMFTVDKLVVSIIKQLIIALGDNKSMELLQMLRRERERERDIRRKYEEEPGGVRVSTSLVHERDLQDQIRYRRDTEMIIGSDEHQFKICWMPAQKLLTFQLMKKQDKSFTLEDSPDSDERWAQYTASYVMDHPTEDEVLHHSLSESMIAPTADGDGDEAAQNSDADSSADDSRIKRPFLKRNLVQDKAPRKRDGTGVEVRFCASKYKMFFVANKGDAFWVERPAGDIRSAEERVKTRSEGCKLLL
ncbi:hypothetical protein AURDEDRAFT_110072 [Auricularia subglabra TFB-10046 SS5]|nr:hypothetical protein AURDEDRAFT_110072 [Auricularia subglabra TFB-10046 SS5]